jgi:cell wall-associated NlpC family hydrolase
MSLKTTNSNNRRLEKTATVSFFQNAICCACFVPDNSANACPSAGSFTLEKEFTFPSFDDDLEQVVVTEDLDFALSIKKNEGDLNPTMNYVITGNKVNQDQCPASKTNSYPFVSYMDDAPRVADTNTIFSNLSSNGAAVAVAATASVAVACVAAAGFFLRKTMYLTGGQREIKLNDDETHTSGNFINNNCWV